MNKPEYCHAWVSKVNGQFRCNTIPCCGFVVHGDKNKVLKGFKIPNKDESDTRNN